MGIHSPSVSASADVTATTVAVKVAVPAPRAAGVSFAHSWASTPAVVLVGIPVIVPVAHSPPEAEAA